MLVAAFLFLAASTALEAQARETLAATSANPATVQFRNLRAAGDALCGEVSRPDRRGRRAEYRRFVFFAPDIWALAVGRDYELAVGSGRILDTRALEREGQTSRGMSPPELQQAAARLQQAEAAREQGARMLEFCR